MLKISGIAWRLAATLTLVIVLFASTLLHAAAATVLKISITDSDGRPIARASIDLSGPNAHLSAVTDTRGQARMTLTEAGSYAYRVRVAGFKTRTGNIEVGASATALSLALETSAGGLHVIGSVTGHARTPFNATPVSQKVYPREAYRDQGQPSVASVMNQTPGVFALTPVNVNPATPLATSYASVRNALPFETPFSIDGEPLSLPSNGTFDLSLLPTFALQEVEVVKGPGDVGGDGSGVGGAINFRTAEPTLLRRGTLEIEGDSRGGSFADLAYDGTEPGGKFAYSSMLSADGSPCCDPNPADVSRTLALVKFRETPSSALTVTETVMDVNTQRTLDSLYAENFPSNFIVLRLDPDDEIAQHFVFADSSATYDRGSDAFTAHLYAAQTDVDGTDETASHSVDTTAGGALEWQHTTGRFSYSVSERIARGNASSDGILSQYLETGSGETTALTRAGAVYHPSAREEFDASLETETQDTTTSFLNGPFVHRDFDAPQARVAWSREIEDNLSVRAAYGTSAVLAPLDALSDSTVQDLERATGGDLGLEWRLHGNTTTLSADVYRNATTGVYMQNTDSEWMNGPPMVESGAELTLQQFKPVGFGFIAALDLPRTYVWGNLPPDFYSKGNLAVVPGKNLNGGLFPLLFYNDVAPYRIPYAEGYGEISYKWPRGSRLSLGTSYIGSNNIYGVPGFFTFNSNLELSLGSRSKLQLSAENLFDALGTRVPYVDSDVPFIQPGNPFGPIPPRIAGLQPLTLRFMFRQSFGEGALQER